MSLLIWLTTVSSFGQQIAKRNALTLRIGGGFIMRQDFVFSPFIHEDFSLMNLRLDYTRKDHFLQKVSLQYANFNPMLEESYEFTVHGEQNTAYPHNFNLIDLDYQLGKKIKETKNASLAIGGLFSSDIQAMNYVYGRISSFGYFFSFGLGCIGIYERQINVKSKLEATLKLPLVIFLARSPYLVNDDEFIENISSHSGFKTFMAFLGDGQMTTWNKIQTLDFELKYKYSVSERWEFGADYLFELIHMSQPRNLLSLRNSLNLSATFEF